MRFAVKAVLLLIHLREELADFQLLQFSDGLQLCQLPQFDADVELLSRDRKYGPLFGRCL